MNQSHLTAVYKNKVVEFLGYENDENRNYGERDDNNNLYICIDEKEIAIVPMKDVYFQI